MSVSTNVPASPRRALPPVMSLTDAAADRLRALYAKGEHGRLLRSNFTRHQILHTQ